MLNLVSCCLSLLNPPPPTSHHLLAISLLMQHFFLPGSCTPTVDGSLLEFATNPTLSPNLHSSATVVFFRRLLLMRGDVVQTSLSQPHSNLSAWVSHSSQRGTITPLYLCAFLSRLCESSGTLPPPPPSPLSTTVSSLISPR